MASMAFLKLQNSQSPVTVMEEEQAISFRLSRCCRPLHLGQRRMLQNRPKHLQLASQGLLSPLQTVQVVFLIDYEKGLAPISRCCTLLVVVWLLARSGVDC